VILDSVNQRNVASVVAVLAQCAKLESLFIHSGSNAMNDETLHCIWTAIPQQTNRSLTVDGSLHLWLQPLKPRPFPSLCTLSLRGCHSFKGSIDAAPLFWMAAVVRGAPLLHTLDLSECPALTDAELGQVAASAKALTSLDISGCWDISDAGLAAVLTECEQLQRLKLLHCDRLSDAAVLNAQKQLSLRSCTEPPNAGLRDIEKGRAACGCLRSAARLPTVQRQQQKGGEQVVCIVVESGLHRVWQKLWHGVVRASRRYLDACGGYFMVCGAIVCLILFARKLLGYPPWNVPTPLLWLLLDIFALLPTGITMLCDPEWSKVYRAKSKIW
jgi:hypothetical protein